MKVFLLVTGPIVIGIVALICWERWDERTNRGYSWGYWGEFNTVSNSLARLPGVTVVKAWCNADFLVLEEMWFTVAIQGKTVDIAFGEKNPVRKLRGRALEKALLEMIQKESSNQGAAANRRPALLSDGSGNSSAMVAADRAFSAAVAELERSAESCATYTSGLPWSPR